MHVATSSSEEASGQNPISNFFNQKPKSVIKTLSKTIVFDAYLMTAVDLMPFQCVENPGMKAFFEKYAPPIRLPSSVSKIRELILLLKMNHFVPA